MAVKEVQQKTVRRLGKRAILAFILVVFFMGAGLFHLQADSQKLVHGMVVDNHSKPVPRAIVRVQGSSISTKTDKSGRFTLAIPSDIPGQHITAWAHGYYNGGIDLNDASASKTITLHSIKNSSNENYQWLPSRCEDPCPPPENLSEAKACQACHPGLVEEWEDDAHSRSAVNEIFLKFYGENAGGPSYKKDYPSSAGNCAHCHVPALALENNGRPADPRTAQGPALEGVFCDLCHKIQHAALDETGSRPGISSYTFNLPEDGHQVFYGPYDDVFPGEDSAHPLYGNSQYCAPCHHGEFWGVLAYSEYQEWLESDYPAKGVHCQDCHMKSTEDMERFALEKAGGIPRDPKTIPSHRNFGVEDVDFMKDCVDMTLETRMDEHTLAVEVTIKSINTGHHIPTGNPMRHMILLVEAKDGSGQTIEMSQGSRTPSWCGRGPISEGNYAGLTGKAFAKVLRDRKLYSPASTGPQDFEPIYPAPHWRPVVIESDNRIPADGSDTSSYVFSIPTDVDSLEISARLLFRRGYIEWMQKKGLECKDLELAQCRKTVHVSR